jgi:DNA-binding NarL/FixJ family response regulator
MDSTRNVALRMLQEVRPDIVLLDVRVENGKPTLGALIPSLPGKVVAIGVVEAAEDVVACAEAGIAGYVPREGSLCDLLNTIDRVAADELPCPPRIAASLANRLAALSTHGSDGPAAAQLTNREREVLRLINDGLANKEIASRLSIELSTVKNHVHNILEKLGTHRRGEAAAKFRSEAAGSRT